VRIRGRTLLVVVAGGASLATAFGVLAWRRAGRAISEAETAVDAAATIRVARSRVSTHATSGIEYLPAAAGFRDAAVFGGRLYLGGGSGLVAVDELGRIERSWRTGEQLPAAVVALAATPADLWIATAGAGLLRYDGAAFEQILPDEADLRSFTAVHPMSTGGVLLGTASRGVLAYDGKRMRVLHGELAQGRVNALAGTDTDLWVATADRGLLHLRGGQIRTFTELPEPNVLSVAADSERAWA
jgi:ligand-binding sensor domain-containing protein